MRFWSLILAFLWTLVAVGDSLGQAKPKKPKKKKPKVKQTKWDEMDIGSFQAYSLETQLGGKPWRPALKGLNIKLGQNASLCFDTERLRVAAAWKNGFIKLDRKSVV